MYGKYGQQFHKKGHDPSNCTTISRHHIEHKATYGFMIDNIKNYSYFEWDPNELIDMDWQMCAMDVEFGFDAEDQPFAREVHVRFKPIQCMTNNETLLHAIIDAESVVTSFPQFAELTNDFTQTPKSREFVKQRLLFRLSKNECNQKCLDDASVILGVLSRHF